MGQSMGMLDFFVLEAGEYLERLDVLAQTPAGAFRDIEEFVRIARAFRGSALMASQPAMARGAQGLEAVGRGVRDGRVAWDERARGEVVRAVDDCQRLLRNVRAPAADDADRAEAMAAALERLAGRAAAGARPAGAGLDAGARAFVAREAAAIASTLDQASRALAAEPAGREALGGVAPAMSALRGVAVLNDLPPLGDILVGVEGALKEVFATSGAVGPTVPAVFDAAAKALARAAREVVDLGHPAPDSEQAGVFAALLLNAFAGAGDVRPIEALFFDDAGPHVVQQGAVPAELSHVELVSQGEFLEKAADELRRAASPILRDLRLFAIGAALRPLAGGGGPPAVAALGRFAEAGRTAIERGAAAEAVEEFAAAVAEAARALRAARAGEGPDLLARLDAATAQLAARAAAAGAPGQVAPPAPARPRTTRVIPALAELPAHAEAPETGDGGSDLAAGYAALERLIDERGLPMGSLAELLGEDADVVPIESLAPDEGRQGSGAFVAPPPDSRPDTVATAPDADVLPIESLAPDEVVPIPSGPPGDADVVPIERLLYGGAGALRRALELRAELVALASAGGAPPQLSELQREVFDLVELGLGARP